MKETEELLIGIKFKDPDGNIHIARTDDEFDEYMDHEDWCLWFD